MVDQYPSVLKCKIPGQSTVVGGITIPGNDSTDVEYECRYRPNTSAKTIRNSDNVSVVYRGTCYVDALEVEIKTGDIVTVEGFIENVEVLQVYPAQMRVRIIL